MASGSPTRRQGSTETRAASAKGERTLPFRPAGRSRPRPSRFPTRWTTIPATRRLRVGKGYVENVTPEMWAYEVSGKQVLWHWFSYRRRDRSSPDYRRPASAVAARFDPAGPLAAGIHDDLLDLSECPRSADCSGTAAGDLLDRICDGPLRSADELREAGAFAMPDEKSAAAKGKSKSKT